MSALHKGLISVIVPVYNAEQYLSHCIESILSQSFTSIELILVDDGSTDDSLNICHMFEKQDDRVKVVTKQNSGVSDTRNLGISNSSGDYICFVDSDDMLKVEALETLHREMIESDVDVVFCNYEFDYSGNRVQKKSRLPSGIYDVSSVKERLIDDGTLSGMLFGSVWAALYKKSIAKERNVQFDSGVKHNEDGLFNLKYIQFCNSIKVLSDAYLYIYRSNDESASRTVNLNENKFSAANEILNTLFVKDGNASDQMRARNVSIGLWKILEICNINNKDKLANKLTAIRNVCYSEQVIKGLNHIDAKNLNRYKLTYFYLIKHKRVHSMYLLTRYIYPILTKIMAR